MSTFENYDATSQHYDETRVPVGREIILGCLASLSGPGRQLALLDAGCGTGAYSKAIVDHVGQIDALDMSNGMLQAARAKLWREQAEGRVQFHQGSITELPFPDGSFDAVMINQVVHHLGDRTDLGFPHLRKVIGEFARVLRPGGGVIFNHCSHEQLRQAYWYAGLIPTAVALCCSRFAPLDVLRELFEEAGFLLRGSFVPTDAVCQGADYFDGRGPLSAAWRAGDSIWAQVDEAELAAAQARIESLDAAGELEVFVAAQDARRPTLGQITILFATK